MHVLCLRVGLLLAVFGITACSVLPERQTISIKHYSLPVAAFTADVQAKPAGILLVSRPRAKKAFDTQLMAYRYNATEVSYYAESRWVDTPAQLIADSLQLQLEQQGLFEAAVPQGTPVTADWRLELELLRFVQDFSAGEPVFEAQMRVRLIDVLDRNIAATKVFTVKEPMSASRAEAGVAAAVNANARLISDVVQFLATATQSHEN